MEKNKLLVRYCDMIQLRKYSPETDKSYLYHLKKFLDFKSNIYPSNLSSKDINDYLVNMNGTEVSDSYFNQAINAIRFFFIYVLNRKIKDYMVVRPKKAKTQPILLSGEELQALFDVVTNKKHRAIMSLIMSAGLRVSEVINLKISDIDSKCMVIRITSGKGRKDRLCVLDSNVLIRLREYFVEYKPVEFLFNGQNKLQYTKRSIEEFFKEYAVKAGIKKRVYPHLLRHQQITGMLEGGVDIHAIQIHSGHANQRTTAGYIHMSPKYIASLRSPINNIRI